MNLELDRLSGGIFAAIFAAYGGIAYFQNQMDLAAFCGIMMGGILAFCGSTFRQPGFIWAKREFWV